MSDTVKAALIIGICLMLGLWGAGWLNRIPEEITIKGPAAAGEHVPATPEEIRAALEVTPEQKAAEIAAGTRPPDRFAYKDGEESGPFNSMSSYMNRMHPDWTPGKKGTLLYDNEESLQEAFDAAVAKFNEGRDGLAPEPLSDIEKKYLLNLYKDSLLQGAHTH